MKCERIEIVNFCQHRYREEVFEDGLTAIIGANGSGKSNFLGAIRFAITGDNPNVGTKAANICDLAPPEETSYVELDFSHGGTRATVRRNLRPTRPTATLHEEGRPPIEGDQLVSARIHEILGIGNDIINDVIIVAQDEIFGFLDRLPAKRAEQFQKLFHTEKAAVVYKVIGDQLKTVEIPAVGVDMDALRVQIRQADEQIRILRDQLAPLPNFDDIRRHREDNAQLVRDFDQQARLQQQLDGLGPRRDQATAAKEAAVAQKQSAETDLRTIQQAAEGNREAAEAARAKLVNLDRVKANRAAREAAESRISVIQQQLGVLIEPEKPVAYVARRGYVGQDPYARLASMRSALERLQTFIASFNDGVAECPTCGTPATTLEVKLQEARAQIPHLDGDIADLEKNLKASEKYDDDLLNYTNRKATLESNLQQVEQGLAELPPDDGEDLDEIQLNQTVANDKTYADGIREYNQTIASHAQTISRCDGQLEMLRTQIDELFNTLATMPNYTAEQRATAEQNVAGWDRADANRREWESQLTMAQASKASAEQQLQNAAAGEQQARLLRGWHAFAQELRGIVHKDAAPRFVAQRNLRRLQHSINESLEMFDTPYRVTANEGLSFEAMFNNGTRQPAERLSEGQKVILALSFRLALNLMFAENVGALYLDEPTAYLDEHHIRGFEPVLNQLRVFSASRGLQCMIITHERDLAPLFDSVINLQ